MTKNISSAEQKMIDQAMQEKVGPRYRSLANNWQPKFDPYPREKEFAQDNKILGDQMKPSKPRD